MRDSIAESGSAGSGEGVAAPSPPGALELLPPPPPGGPGWSLASASGLFVYDAMSVPTVGSWMSPVATDWMSGRPPAPARPGTISIRSQPEGRRNL